MKLVAIDTSSKILCLGVFDGTARYEYNLEVSTRLSRLLVPTLKRVLEALSLKPRDIDCFACGIGPGSFTGVRVGMAAVKAMAWASAKPVVGIPSLDALARGLQDIEGFIVPAIDAKRGLMYSCVYQRKNKKLRRLTPHMLLGCEELTSRIKHTVKSQGLEKTWILGDGLAVHREAICRAMPEVHLAEKDFWQLSAGSVLGQAIELACRRTFSDAFRIKPLYLYPKECQIRHTGVSPWSTPRKK